VFDAIEKVRAVLEKRKRGGMGGGGGGGARVDDGRARVEAHGLYGECASAVPRKKKGKRKVGVEAPLALAMLFWKPRETRERRKKRRRKGKGPVG